MNSSLQKLTSLVKKITTGFIKEQSINKNTSSRINSLAPKILESEADIEKVKPYLDSLKNAIDKEDVNNIAVTGSFGSGKSTLLKTFQHRFKQYCYLNISLASFKDNKDGTNDDQALERRLEISILQQMFYHVAPSEIPDSRFKRIVNVTQKKLFLLTGFLIIWILSTLTLFKFGYIDKLDPNKWKTTYPLDWIVLFSSIIFFIGVALFVKSVYRLLSNSKISKLNIKGELELGESIDKSVFNQHLEEILYFFERTEFNVVVIEDVDRFNSTDIFTKLREINILLNNSKLINRPIKFVYAIKDEMFKDKNERVKFFEFIIPIIPFINPSNANDQLSMLISNANLKGVLSTEFTSDVITFIDDIDMRLLINIFQEYEIYRKVLSQSLKQDNLFAILVYKNLYPEDFGELSKRKGRLYRLLTDKQIYTNELKKGLDTKIQNLESRINHLDEEKITNLTELRAIYVSVLVSKLKNFHSFYTDKEVSLADAVNDENFNHIKNSANIIYKRYELNTGRGTYTLDGPFQSGITLSSINNEVSASFTYDQREELIKSKASNQIDSLKFDKEKLKNQISEIESLSIQEIFLLIDITRHLDSFNESYLMRNLIVNGYIDEHFEDYISLFHEVSLTKDDFQFERNVKGNIPLPFEYKLTNIETLIKRLPEKYFGREVIWNYSILETLLANDSRFSFKTNRFFKGLSADGGKQFQFIYNFIKTGPKDLSIFIERLCETKPEIWTDVSEKSGLPDSEIQNIIKLIFEHARLESILAFDSSDKLGIYIEEIAGPFSFLSSFINTENILKFIRTKELRFKTLDSFSSDQKDDFLFLYEGNHYLLSYDNIRVIIEGNELKFQQKQLNTSHFTVVLQTKLNSLIRYIDNNLENYLTDTFLKLETNKNEHEESLIHILNRKDISLKLKEAVLISQETVISSIELIDDISAQELVISKSKVIATWSNVLTYFDNTELEDFDDAIAMFLNDPENYVILSKEKLKSAESMSEEYIKNISDIFIHSNSLNIDAYFNLLDSIPYTYKFVRCGELDEEKISKLLEKKKLSLTAQNFAGLKSKGGELAIKLIVVHQKEFLTKLSELDLDPSDWNNIFKSSSITEETKLELIQTIDDSIIINDSSIAALICSIIPIDRYIPLRFEVLNTMFSANNSTEKRVRLINLHFQNLDDKQIQVLTEKLGVDYARIFMKQHKPVFPNQPYNIEFFTKLKEKDLIIRYEKEDKDKSIRVLAKYQ
jgi:DNA-dependent RNA polymerase auxiliary subunit epsilon